MHNKQSSIYVTIALTFSVFFSVLYTSCNRKSNATSPDKCINVSCRNGGVCSQGICSCPNGYEDEDCSTVSVDRYLGSWVMHDSVVGSDHPSALHTSATYPITITPLPGSSIDFYINGITGNMGFQNLPCRMQDTLDRKFEPRQFRCTDLFGYNTPSRLIIVSYKGVVNLSGNYFHGTYIKQYPIADSTVQNDTLVYYSLRQ